MPSRRGFVFGGIGAVVAAMFGREPEQQKSRPLSAKAREQIRAFVRGGLNGRYRGGRKSSDPRWPIYTVENCTGVGMGVRVFDADGVLWPHLCFLNARPNKSGLCKAIDLRHENGQFVLNAGRTDVVRDIVWLKGPVRIVESNRA